MRVALVGCGIGKAHAAAYTSLPEQFELAVICDLVPERARVVAEANGVQRLSADLADVCAMSDIDIVDICTPPHLHVAHVRQALAAGKHCICEKPLAGSLREIDVLAAAEAASGRRVMPVFQYRFGHGLQKLKLLQEEGIAGRAYVSNVDVAWRRRAQYYTDRAWRGFWTTEVGGALTGHAIHALDMLMYVLGPVRRVIGMMATSVNDIEVEDTAAVSMEMADGSLATLSLTLGSAPEISRHRFCFSGLVAESNTRPYTSSGEPWAIEGDTPASQAQIERTLAGFSPLPEGFVGQFWRMHRALTDGGELPVTLADGRRSIELLTAIYKSVKTGQPVLLPLRRDRWYDGWGEQMLSWQNKRAPFM